jgi:bifunctional UDP-N-acetylglucosamine pyrophosphorylase/glucosamine-1-phosphate N-acetyltransferase
MNTQIIILAAGHGKRMKSELPKALTPFRGKPFVKHVLDAVAESGVCDDPIIVIGEKGDQVNHYLGENHRYAIQKEKLGTGHAVMMAEDKVGEKDTVMVLYADSPLIKPETIKNLNNIHKEKNATVTMATTTVEDFLTWKNSFISFGRIVRDENGEIIKIIEAKDANEEEKKTKELNPAFMCFNAVWMWEHLRKLQNKNAQGEYYLTDLIGMAFDENKKIASINIDPREAFGVNTKEQLELLEGLI